MSTPRQFGFDYEDVFFETADGVRLHAWRVLPKSRPIGRVLYLHGNAQNISHHLPVALWWVEAGYELLALDYRGYGLSGGYPSLEGALQDLEAAGRWFGEFYPEPVAAATRVPVYVFAQSLGASLAILWLARDDAARATFDAAVLEAGFASFGGVAGEVAANNWFTWPLQWIPRLSLAGTIDPAVVIGDIDIPLVILHSEDDTIVDSSHALKLFAAAQEPKLLLMSSGPHILVARDPETRQEIVEFLEDAGRASNEPAISAVPE